MVAVLTGGSGRWWLMVVDGGWWLWLPVVVVAGGCWLLVFENCEVGVYEEWVSPPGDLACVLR